MSVNPGSRQKIFSVQALWLLASIVTTMASQAAFCDTALPGYIGGGIWAGKLAYISVDGSISKIIEKVPAGPVAKASIGIGASSGYLGYAWKNKAYSVSTAGYLVAANKYFDLDDGKIAKKLFGVEIDLITAGFHGTSSLGLSILRDRESNEWNPFLSIGIGF